MCGFFRLEMSAKRRQKSVRFISLIYKVQGVNVTGLSRFLFCALTIALSSGCSLMSSSSSIRADTRAEAQAVDNSSTSSAINCQAPSLTISGLSLDLDLQQIKSINVLNVGRATAEVQFKDGRELGLLSIDEALAGGSVKAYQQTGTEDFPAFIKYLADSHQQSHSTQLIRQALGAKQAGDIHIREFAAGWIYWVDSTSAEGEHFLHLLRYDDSRIIRVVMDDLSDQRVQEIVSRLCW